MIYTRFDRHNSCPRCGFNCTARLKLSKSFGYLLRNHDAQRSNNSHCCNHDVAICFIGCVLLEFIPCNIIISFSDLLLIPNYQL